MVQAMPATNKMSLRRIIGFACNQAFVFFLLYMGFNRSFQIGSFTFERAELFVMLLFIALAFALIKLVSDGVRNTLLSKPLLIAYALMVALGSFLPLILADAAAFWLPVEGILLGVPSAFLLTAWGRAFGGASTKVSVPEVFLGSIVGALCCLFVSLIPIAGAVYVLPLLALVSASMLAAAPKSEQGLIVAVVVESTRSDTAVLSLKIVAGTALFGMAAGLMETFSADPGVAAMPFYPISFLLFGAFALGTLSLLLSDGFGKGAALNKAYRLAVFLTMAGFLLIPLPQFAESLIPGEAIVLAGYLGLTAVLISLFLVLAKLNGADTAASFSRGFGALFIGELVGVGIANIFDWSQPDFATPYAVVVFAGILVLFSYIFLFTERDFESLSEIVTNTDSFEDACRAIADEFGLSNRETEILPLALRGRTSERISQEMHISKSTVDTHLRRIYSKAGVHNRQELIDLGEAKRLPTA